MTQRWTPAELPDLTGTRAVVTGANVGIGFHTARELAAHGAEVVLACRNLQAATDAAARIPGTTRVERLDLASVADVRAFTDRWEGPLDLLVNNAGVMTPPRFRRTADGHELMFGTNHLGHVALTAGLLPALLAAGTPRVVTVSSIAHHHGGPEVLQANPEQGYRPQTYYGHSKLANLLFARELHRRATAAEVPLASTAAHPGVSATNLVASSDGMGALPLVRIAAPYVMPVLFQSAARGADPVLYAATAAAPGSYTGPRRLRESRGPIGEARLSRHARDEELAARLWETSNELTGAHWPF